MGAWQTPYVELGTQQQRPEPPSILITWHASKHRTISSRITSSKRTFIMCLLSLPSPCPFVAMSTSFRCHLHVPLRPSTCPFVAISMSFRCHPHVLSLQSPRPFVAISMTFRGHLHVFSLPSSTFRCHLHVPFVLPSPYPFVAIFMNKCRFVADSVSFLCHLQTLSFPPPSFFKPIFFLICHLHFFFSLSSSCPSVAIFVSIRRHCHFPSLPFICLSLTSFISFNCHLSALSSSSSAVSLLSFISVSYTHLTLPTRRTV